MMMNDATIELSKYQQARSWSDQYLDQVRQLIGQHLFRISTELEDTRQATDLVMLETRQTRIRNYRS